MTTPAYAGFEPKIVSGCRNGRRGKPRSRASAAPRGTRLRLPFHYLTPPRERARKDSKPSGVIHMPTPIHKRKRSKKRTLRRLRDCPAFPPKTIIQGGTTKQSAANSSSRLTEGERLWRPEKIAAVAVAPSQRRLKVIFRTVVVLFVSLGLPLVIASQSPLRGKLGERRLRFRSYGSQVAAEPEWIAPLTACHPRTGGKL